MKAGASGGRERGAATAAGLSSARCRSPAPGAGSSGLPEKLWRIVPSASTARSIVPLMSKLRISLNWLRTSSRLASRIMSSTWVWNSPAMRRAFLTIPLTAFMATGRSFGPMATRATTPISTISDQAKSNMRALHLRGRLVSRKPFRCETGVEGRAEPWPSFSQPPAPTEPRAARRADPHAAAGRADPSARTAPGRPAWSPTASAAPAPPCGPWA